MLREQDGTEGIHAAKGVESPKAFLKWKNIIRGRKLQLLLLGKGSLHLEGRRVDQ